MCEPTFVTKSSFISAGQQQVDRLGYLRRLLSIERRIERDHGLPKGSVSLRNPRGGAEIARLRHLTLACGSVTSSSDGSDWKLSSDIGLEHSNTTLAILKICRIG